LKRLALRLTPQRRRDDALHGEKKVIIDRRDRVFLCCVQKPPWRNLGRFF
jgi:hypothetical protein